MRRVLIAVCAVSLLGLFPPSADATPASVTIKDFQFQQSPVTVQVGETVTWTNEDSVAHTATSDGNFDTSPGCSQNNTEDESCLKPNAPVSVTFNTPGTFDYHCKIHRNMTGTVIVEGDSKTSTTTSTTTTTTEPPTSEPAVTSQGRARGHPAAVCLGVKEGSCGKEDPHAPTGSSYRVRRLRASASAAIVDVDGLGNASFRLSSASTTRSAITTRVNHL